VADNYERPSLIDAAWDKPASSRTEPRASVDPPQSFAAAQSLFTEGRLEDAWEEAEIARTGFAAVDPLAETDVLYLLACIAKERGFARVGEERIARAIAERTDLAEGTVPLAWYELHAALAAANGEYATATGAWDAAVKVARSVRDATGEGTERLCVALRALGDAQLALGNNVRALRVFRDLVTEARELAAASSDPHAFRHLTSALHRLGDAQHSSGDLAGAIGAYRDAVREAKRIAATVGETAETLWDLSVGLNRLGGAQLEAEQAQAAIASFEQSVEARRAFVEQAGRDPHALLGLASSLSKLGGALLQDGDEAGAQAATAEAAALDEEAAMPDDSHPLTMWPPPVAT
jgi:tetratricopeptide (TPR) repeat protein